jgi:ketosteroid isomerase-like protein
MSQENVEIVRGVRIALPPLSDSASQRRTLDERFFVRFRRLMLPTFVRRSYAAGSRQDFEVLLMRLDPEIEFRPGGGLWAADLDTVVEGRDGYREVWQTTLDAFENLQVVPEEVLDLGHQLLVTVEYRGHGSGSGVPVSQRVVQLLEARRGLVVKIEDFTDRSEALEAAGLRE